MHRHSNARKVISPRSTILALTSGLPWLPSWVLGLSHPKSKEHHNRHGHEIVRNLSVNRNLGTIGSERDTVNCWRDDENGLVLGINLDAS